MGAPKRKRDNNNTGGGPKHAKKPQKGKHYGKKKGNKVVQPPKKTAGVTSRPMLLRAIAKQAGFAGMSPSAPRTDLLQADDRYYCELIELIPADMYYPEESTPTTFSKRKEHKKYTLKMQKGEKRKQRFDAEEFPSLQHVGLAQEQGSDSSDGEVEEKEEPKTENRKVKRVKQSKVDTKVSKKKSLASAEALAESVRENVASRMGTISYGNLDLTGEGKELFNGVEKKTVKGQTTRKILDVQKLIKEAELNQERMNSLKKNTKDGEAVDRLSKDDKLFETMEQKALGAKVRDNPKLLKKTLKRLEQKKKKSAKAWGQRIKTTEDAKRSAKEKKDSNVAKQQKGKLEAKLKRKGINVPKDPAEKQPRSRQQRPGFEGKHKGFLNDSGKKDAKGTTAKSPKKVSSK